MRGIYFGRNNQDLLELLDMIANEAQIPRNQVMMILLRDKLNLTLDRYEQTQLALIRHTLSQGE